MTLKNDEKFEVELTCHFKIDVRNLTNFNPSTLKSQKCELNNGLFLGKVYIF